MYPTGRRVWNKCPRGVFVVDIEMCLNVAHFKIFKRLLLLHGALELKDKLMDEKYPHHQERKMEDAPVATLLCSERSVLRGQSFPPWSGRFGQGIKPPMLAVALKALLAPG